MKSALLMILALASMAAAAPNATPVTVTGPIFHGFGGRNFFEVVGPRKTAVVDAGAAMIRLDDRADPNFKELPAATATGDWDLSVTYLVATEIILHAGKDEQPKFAAMLASVQRAQCQGNLAQLRERVRLLPPGALQQPTTLPKLLRNAPEAARLRCSAGGRYELDSKAKAVRCTTAGHTFAAAAPELVATLPAPPPLDPQLQSITGKVRGEPLKEFRFALLTSQRAYLVVQEREISVSVSTDPAVDAAEWSAALEGRADGAHFRVSRMTLLVSPDRKPQADALVKNRNGESCRRILAQLESAAEQWALDFKKPVTARATFAELVGEDRYLTRLPRCPSGGSYDLRTLREGPACSVPGHTLEVTD